MAIDLPAQTGVGRIYLRIHTPQRLDYYGNEVAQSHGCRARLSSTAMYPNTQVHHFIEIEM